LKRIANCYSWWRLRRVSQFENMPRDELGTWRLLHIALNNFPGFGDLFLIPMISAGIDDTLVEFR
jgi:hypothetical protein